MGEILWCGADDSNHAGTSKGEFIVVTFSGLREDSLVKPFPNHRQREETMAWLKKAERDFRFTLLTREEYRYRGDNVPSIAPFIVAYYLREKKEKYKQINLYLDGWLNGRTKSFIREIISREGIEKVIVDNFTKKGRNKFQKRHFCPEVVYRADNLAHMLFGYDGPIEELLSDSRLVPFESLQNIAREKGYCL